MALITCLQNNKKEFGYIRDYSWKSIKVHFMLLCTIFKQIQFKKHYAMSKNL